MSEASDIERQREFEAMQHRSSARWAERWRDDRSQTEWELLYAYLARVDLDEDTEGERHKARLAFAQAAFNRLLDRDGALYALTEPHRRLLVRRFKPMLDLHGGES